MHEPERTASPRAHQQTPTPPRHSGDQDSGDHAGDRAGDLVDSKLLEEITLLSEVITDVAAHSGHLDADEVDHVLGVGDEEPVT